MAQPSFGTTFVKSTIDNVNDSEVRVGLEIPQRTGDGAVGSDVVGADDGGANGELTRIERSYCIEQVYWLERWMDCERKAEVSGTPIEPPQGVPERYARVAGEPGSPWTEQRVEETFTAWISVDDELNEPEVPVTRAPLVSATAVRVEGIAEVLVPIESKIRAEEAAQAAAAAARERRKAERRDARNAPPPPTATLQSASAIAIAQGEADAKRARFRRTKPAPVQRAGGRGGGGSGGHRR
jgi:hypothetical protein